MPPSLIPSPDPFDLQRFEAAQARNFSDALRELQQGHKVTHWMWYVFPQIAGLGTSEMAKTYALATPDEARAYLAHPILGARLRQCAEALLHVQGRSAHQIMGSPDDVKLRSSMTLFARVAGAPDAALFRHVLEKYYEAGEDERTTAILEGMSR